MDHDLQNLEKQLAEPRAGLFFSLGVVEKLDLGMSEAESSGQAFPSFLADLNRRIKALLVEQMTPEHKKEHEETGSFPFTPQHGWHVPLFQSAVLIYALEMDLLKKPAEKIAWAAFRLGRTLERAELQYQYEEEIQKREHQKQALVKGNQTKEALSHKKKTKAIAELRRRMKQNPIASKTSHINAMAKEKDGDQFRWGSRGSLLKWCKEVKAPKRKMDK